MVKGPRFLASNAMKYLHWYVQLDCLFTKEKLLGGQNQVAKTSMEHLYNNQQSHNDDHITSLWCQMLKIVWNINKSVWGDQIA